MASQLFEEQDILAVMKTTPIERLLEDYVEAISEKADLDARIELDEKAIQAHLKYNETLDVTKQEEVHDKTGEILCSYEYSSNDRYRIKLAQSARKSVKYAQVLKELEVLKSELESELRSSSGDDEYLEAKYNMLMDVLDIWNRNTGYSISERFTVLSLAE